MARGTFITISAAFALGLFAQIGLFAHLIVRLTPDFGAVIGAASISVITLCAILGRTVLAWLLGEHDRRLAMAGQPRDAGGRVDAPWRWAMARRCSRSAACFSASASAISRR